MATNNWAIPARIQGETQDAYIRRIIQHTQAQADAAVAAAKQRPPQRLSAKVSVKGAVSVYGLGRFPVTLYAEQWERLSEYMDDLKAFMVANAGTITRKTPVEEQPNA
jgi:hypothetical protein